MTTITADYGLQWLAWVAGRSAADVADLELHPRQIATLAGWIMSNKTLVERADPPQPEIKTGTFVCKCCGQHFFSTYRTRKPEYVNRNHRMRAYRRRRKKREPGWTSNPNN